jgi:hypothetical protein
MYYHRSNQDKHRSTSRSHDKSYSDSDVDYDIELSDDSCEDFHSQQERELSIKDTIGYRRKDKSWLIRGVKFNVEYARV